MQDEEREIKVMAAIEDCVTELNQLEIIKLQWTFKEFIELLSFLSRSLKLETWEVRKPTL